MFTFSDFLKNSGKSFHKNGAQTLKACQPYDLVVKRVSCLSKRRRSGLAVYTLYLKLNQGTNENMFNTRNISTFSEFTLPAKRPTSEHRL